MTMERLRILVDVDGVLADFTGSFLRCYRLYGGEVPDGWQPSTWTCIDRLPSVGARKAAWEHPDLFRVMEPLPGALDALWHLNHDHDVRLVTHIAAPWGVHVPARMRWLERHCRFLDTTRQVIVTSEKDVVSGDVLVDDYPANLRRWLRANPDGSGALVNQPWNQGGTSLAALWKISGPGRSPCRWMRYGSLAEFALTVSASSRAAS